MTTQVRNDKTAAIGYVLLATLAIACSPSSTSTQPTTASADKPQAATVVITDAQIRQTGIKLGGVDTLTLGKTIQATGRLEAPPADWATVSPPMGGFVRTTRLVEGDYVRKGQVLVTLEHPDYVKLQQEYLQAVAQLRFQRQELDRQTVLAREEVGARRKFQQASADFETTRALVTSLEAQLAQLHLSVAALQKGTISRTISLPAPISGYVDKVNLRIGQYVTSTDILVNIVNKDHLHLELHVFENDISQIREGQLVRFTLPQQQAGELLARVHRVGQAFDEQTKTILVHADLVSKDYKRLIPGSYVRARILAQPRQVVALPEEAVVLDGKRSIVYTASADPSAGGYRFAAVPVKTGVTQNHMIEVTLPPTLRNATTLVRAGAYFVSAERAKE